MKFFRSLSKPLKAYRNNLRYKLVELATRDIVAQLKHILLKDPDSIPVIIISYNNGVYAKNMVEQLNQYNIQPIIIDNNSSSIRTINMLLELEQQEQAYLIKSRKNYGHMVGFLKPIYDTLPEVFAYTDPDLQLNKNLPEDFLSTLKNLTTEIKTFKAGFALSLHGKGKLKDSKFHSCHYNPIHYDAHLSIKEFESRYWINRLQHPTLELYGSPIDTTFAVYRKENYIGDFYSAVRVAGDFSALHLPWFEDLDLLEKDDADEYNNGNISTNWSK